VPKADLSLSARWRNFFRRAGDSTLAMTSNLGGRLVARLLEFSHAVNRRIASRGQEVERQEVSDDPVK
jgi:hypothetical protein